MVGVLELVLDHDLAPGAGLLREDVYGEGADRALGVDELQVEAARLAEHREVLLAGEPLGEVLGLVLPDLPHRHGFNPSEIHLLHKVILA